MELDSLKYIWKMMDAPPASRGNNDREILDLMQKRSDGPVARMRRNLLRESILIVLTYIPSAALYFFLFNGKLAGIGGLFILVLAIFGAYFYKKDSLLRQMQCVDRQVRSSLEQQVRTLKRYTRFYVLAGTLIIPIMFILSYGIIRWKFPPQPGSALFYRISGTALWHNPFFWLIPLAIATIGIYFANNWYVNKLYGRHIARLENLLEEINTP